MGTGVDQQHPMYKLHYLVTTLLGTPVQSSAVQHNSIALQKSDLCWQFIYEDTWTWNFPTHPNTKTSE